MSFLDRFEERGFLTFSGLFDRDFIDSLNAEYLRQFDALTAESAPEVGLKVGGGRFMLSVQLRGPYLDPRLYANPMLLGVASALLGPDYLIDSVIVVAALPGAELQHLHRDHPELFPEAPELLKAVPPYGLVAAIPLVDLTEETGTTKVHAGSHRGVPEDEASAELPYLSRGDCLLFDYRLRHQGTANAGARQRPVIYISYTRQWFTDLRNFGRHGRITIDPADLHSIPEQHRHLFRRLAQKGGLDRTTESLFA